MFEFLCLFKSYFNCVEQLCFIEGFGDVIVRPEIEPEYFLRFVRARRKEQNRRRHAGLAQLAAHLESIAAREHHVEQDEIFDLPGVVSRKKQLIPFLTTLIKELASEGALPAPGGSGAPFRRKRK